MKAFTESRLLELFGLRYPLIQAPMAGANDAALVIAVSNTGALGSLPCALFDTEKVRAQLEQIRSASDRPFNVNFFCHREPKVTALHEDRWRVALEPFYLEAGIDPKQPLQAASRAPFSADMCELMEEFKPKVVSFHFGLPVTALVERLHAAGCKVISSATTVEEAVWLEANGCDAIIAQGVEAGGHRGMFLSDDISTQTGSLSLLPQVVDAVSVPVIAAGGFADARGIAAAFTLGAAGVQLGSAYLFTEEALIPDMHRRALMESVSDNTALTNVFSGRPARGLMTRVMRELGPMSSEAPPFPTAGAALAPLKSSFEKQGKSDFTSLWAGQGYALTRKALADSPLQSLAQSSDCNDGQGPLLRIPAAELTQWLADLLQSDF